MVSLMALQVPGGPAELGEGDLGGAERLGEQADAGTRQLGADPLPLGSRRVRPPSGGRR